MKFLHGDRDGRRPIAAAHVVVGNHGREICCGAHAQSYNTAEQRREILNQSLNNSGLRLLLPHADRPPEQIRRRRRKRPTLGPSHESGRVKRQTKIRKEEETVQTREGEKMGRAGELRNCIFKSD